MEKYSINAPLVGPNEGKAGKSGFILWGKFYVGFTAGIVFLCVVQILGMGGEGGCFIITRTFNLLYSWVIYVDYTTVIFCDFWDKCKSSLFYSLVECILFLAGTLALG